MSKWLLRLALLAVIGLGLPRAAISMAGLWGMAFPPEQGLTLYLAPEKVVLVKVRTLPDDTMRVLFENFAGEPGYAAFAADETGHWGWATGKHSPGAAQEQALARCLGHCEVIFEYRPAAWQADRPGQTASFAATKGILSALKATRVGTPVFYALAEDGSWAMQLPGDTGYFPQWAVLDRCRAMLEPRRKTWPHSLPWPQCRIYSGVVTLIDENGVDLTASKAKAQAKAQGQTRPTTSG